VVPSKQTINLRRGDRLVLLTTGGGGYGDPRTRPPEQVLDDVMDGKVSGEGARERYGVVIENGSIAAVAR
jgi:N-methylhydantoinase B